MERIFAVAAYAARASSLVHPNRKGTPGHMRTFLRASAAALLVTVGLGACSKAASTGPSVTCGTGTHDNGAGTCQLDNALTLDNSVGNNYWACPNPGARGSFYFYLAFASNGSAVVWDPAQTVQTTQRSPLRSDDISQANAYAHYPITWQEGSATDEITVSTNPYFDTLMSIVPSATVGAQSFTAQGYKSGVHVYTLSCNLTLGSF